MFSQITIFVEHETYDELAEYADAVERLDDNPGIMATKVAQSMVLDVEDPR